MRNEPLADVWKVWLYAAASIVLGAWMSPLLYNAGKALAEISQSKTTNEPLEWLAERSRVAEFPRFYQVALILAAFGLFFPWMEWLHARRGKAGGAGGPWRLRLPDGARASGRGQALVRNPRALWHGCAGFLLAAGLLLSLAMGLNPAARVAIRHADMGLVSLLAGSLLAAFLSEVAFRGIATGIFLRAMRPAAALAMSAVFFALVLAAVPPAGMGVVDPEAPGPGFALLLRVAACFGDWRFLMAEFLPLLVLGGVLAHARWRTASLWLPGGLHAGWWFASHLLAEPIPATALSVWHVWMLGLVPALGILSAGLLARFLVTHPTGGHALES